MNKEETPKETSVQDEISTMLKSLNEGLGEPTETKEEEKKDDNATSTVDDTSTGNKHDDVLSDTEKVREVVSEEVVPVTVETEKKTEEKKVEEHKLDDKDKVIADLRAKLAEKETAKIEPKVEPKIEPKPEPKLEEQDFLKDLDLDDLTRDPKEFNKVLNKVYAKAAEDVKKGILNEIPEVVKTNIAIMDSLKKTSEDFYKDNPDLNQFKKVVQVVFDELATANPNEKLEELMKRTGPEVRKRLELPTKVITKSEEKKVEVKDEKKPPKLPSKGGRAGKTGEKSVEPILDEISKMNETLGR